ncbi:protein-tyrosine phosphatase-like protein [Mycena amicta]|nr:protein-tyrosine phosphatase-like protein [Mycena amicta]
METSYRTMTTTTTTTTTPSRALRLNAYGRPIQDLDYDYQLAEMTSILPGLFLGSERNARDGPALCRNRITHILSVMPTPPEVQFPDHIVLASDGEQEGVTAREQYQPKRLMVPVMDVAEEELFPYFSQTTAFIDDARNSPQPGAVLVHCQMGVSRSPTVVAAYLMSTNPSTPTLTSALAFLESKRCIVWPNWGFREQLALYHQCACDIPLPVDSSSHPQNRDAMSSNERRRRELAVEKWRVGMAKRKRLALDKMRREHEQAMRAEWEGSAERNGTADGRNNGSVRENGSASGRDGAWVKNWRTASRWAASVLV